MFTLLIFTVLTSLTRDDIYTSHPIGPTGLTAFGWNGEIVVLQVSIHTRAYTEQSSENCQNMLFGYLGTFLAVLGLLRNS